MKALAVIAAILISGCATTPVVNNPQVVVDTRPKAKPSTKLPNGDMYVYEVKPLMIILSNRENVYDFVYMNQTSASDFQPGDYLRFETVDAEPMVFSFTNKRTGYSVGVQLLWPVRIVSAESPAEDGTQHIQLKVENEVVAGSVETNGVPLRTTSRVQIPVAGKNWLKEKRTRDFGLPMYLWNMDNGRVYKFTTYPYGFRPIK